jgi:hypothetical protein
MKKSVRFLRGQTGGHIHADLIAGLPGETFESFGAGFDRLIALGPQEIQVGILKRLRGTPIVRHDEAWQMVYNPHPPYEILQNKLIDFATMQRLRRFARYWDLVGNSGNFIETTPLIWNEGDVMSAAASPFGLFMRWSDWLHARTGRSDGFALARLMELLFEFLTGELKRDPHRIAAALWRDYQRGGRRDKPAFLKQFLPAQEAGSLAATHRSALPKRQARHLV